MLDFTRIAVGEGTPLCCAACGPSVDRSYYPAEELVDEIARAARSPLDATGPNICLGGPEPFGHPELPRLVAACRESGARRVALETDGAALSVRANAAGVLAAGVHHLHVRLLEADARHGDEMAAKPGTIRDSLAGVTAYLESAAAASVVVVVTLVVPVCPHNLSALPAIVLQGAEIGAHAVRLIAGAPLVASAPSFLPAAAPSILAAACDTGMVNGLWVEADEHLPLPGTHGLHVVPGGSCDA